MKITTKNCLIIILLLIFSLSLNAQKRDNSKLSPEGKHDVAQKMIELGGYYSAITILKDLVVEIHLEL